MSSQPPPKTPRRLPVRRRQPPPSHHHQTTTQNPNLNYNIQIMQNAISSGTLNSLPHHWLSSWLNTLYLNLNDSDDIVTSISNLEFIPLSDGTYTSLSKGVIWLDIDETAFRGFDKLYANLRVVNPDLLNSSDSENVNNVTEMLVKLGVRRFSLDDVLDLVILPFLCGEKTDDREVIIECLLFVMFCLDEVSNRDEIVSRLSESGCVWTSDGGCKRLGEVDVHFGRGYGKLVSGSDVMWYEVDVGYMDHPVVKASLPDGGKKVRKMLERLGVTDFVKIEKKVYERRENVRKCKTLDYDSPELKRLLSHVSLSCDREKGRELLEVIDSLWVECFSEKSASFGYVEGKYTPFKCSIKTIFQGVPWLASSVDDQLHFPKNLYYNCQNVRKVFGDRAPYAIPKVNNVKLANYIGLKSTVTLDDALSVLELWRKSENFKASISEMSKFYTYIWKEMSISKQKIVGNLHSQAFIFVPYSFGYKLEEVSGLFLSPNEVYWHDSTGLLKQTKSTVAHSPFSKMLCKIYPDLHDFFVDEFGVDDNTPLSCYLEFLRQLSSGCSPLLEAKTVFQVFQKWSDGLDSGVLRSDDIDYLKKSMEEKEMTILPTVQDKWVSLHQSFGLVCWCDDEELKKDFQNLNVVNFLCLGNLTAEEKQNLQDKVFVLFRRLGISSLSEVVTREAMYDGLSDSSCKSSLVSWALPYAQRYIYSNHENEYFQLKLSGFKKLNCLKVVVAEKLFYRNVVKRFGIKSTKRYECSCLLQDNILYATVKSNPISLFTELSRFLAAGIPESPLANFLDLITTMKESGFTEKQLESHVTNVQNLKLLPNEESQWSVSSMPSTVDDKITPIPNLGLSLDDVNTKPVDNDSIESNGERIIEQSPASAAPSVTLEEDEALKDQSGTGIDTQFSEMKIGFVGQSDHGKGIVSSKIDRLSLGTVTAQQANGVKGSGQTYGINEEEAAKVIENIRREEFGMDPAFSAIEENFLKKQNARLGRALQHLSVDLYSQDSHFLLELIQNADDNEYPCDVEPTLTFILLETGVVVLNNEQGFSAENIKALCDVGNSTKKEHSAGYIGKKGIGFKSVFRVTDAPEIHSNGFHIKFDTSEGEIGFVLPTNVPPCDINVFSDPTDEKDWNTCIMLPFKSKKNEDLSVEKLSSMFFDLHPSLLLFLHRLKCIKFRNLLDDSLIVMRKEALGNGIVNVSTGTDNLTWFVESRKLKSSHIREDVETTEISVALTLEYDPSNGNYIPKLDQQQVFAFLPLRAYGLKFIVQADFVLSSSREEVNKDSPWNKFLLSEFPNLFVSAEQSFCSLPCFKENPAKGVSVFMSFVPLVGEVDGFFSQLPSKIISKLRKSKCLLLEGDNNEWVPPSNVLRNWTEETRSLLPESLIKELLGVGIGYLNKDTVLTDSLAQALHIEECGPKFLIRCMSSLCAGSLKSTDLSWISSWLNVLFLISGNGNQAEVISSLYKLRFIPLVEGTYTSLQDGQIWLHTDPDPDHRFEAFGKLYTKLRVVNPALFSDSHAENVTQMLYKVGVQRLSEHEVLKKDFLPDICNEIYLKENTGLITELLSFVMFHLETSCHECLVEKEHILSQLRNYAFISTNHGYKRLADVPIHFSKEFGNLIDISKLVSGTDMSWFEIDKSYLEHAVYKSSPAATSKLKKFLQELGVTDFVKITKEEKYISPGSVVTDYSSLELWHLLSHVSSNCDRQKCKHLLKVLDTLWDDYSSDKHTAFCCTNGQFTPLISSLIQILHGVPWLVSSMDDQLHFPYEVYHNCEAVHAVLGDNAPYCIPKVNNVKLLNDIGLKNTVHLDDALSVLEAWRRSKKPFKASISQMAKFYTYIWNEMSNSKQKIVENLHSQAFIFVPYLFGSTTEVVSGLFLSPTDVYWHDSIVSSIEQEKSTHPQLGQPATQRPFSRMLFSFYPGLQYFFVNEFGVAENPPLRSYLQVLLQLSTESSPSQASKTVFLVFEKWSDGLDSGVLSSADVDYMKKIMEEKEMKILPTVKNKWVSLHQSFGLICWCDDEELRKEFMNSNGIDFLSFGELTDLEKQTFQTKVSVLCQRLGIPSLSEVVTREAIPDGLRDDSFKTSLVNWALPFTQRYIYSNHPNEYSRLKLSEFNNINSLKIVVVEKLFYKNVVKRHGIKSDNRYECNCLVQDNVLYATHESDSYSLFKKLSRILLAGILESYLANFLQLITTLTETGKTKDQMELFIVNSQNIQKLPSGESQWSLVSLPSPEQDSTWPPAHWKTQPKLEYVSETKVVNADQTRHDVTEEFITSDGDLNNEEVLASMMGSLKLEDAAAKKELQDSGIYTFASNGYIGFEGQFVFGQNNASYTGDVSAFSRHSRPNLFKRHQQSWRTVTPQTVINEGTRDFMTFSAGQQYDNGAESISEQTIQDNPASTTTSVILEQDKAFLKDQSESGISTVSSDTELGFKDQSGYKTPDSFGRDTAKIRRDATERFIEIDSDQIIKENSASTIPSVILEENETSKDQLDSGVDASPVTPQHVITGRTGEEEAYKFFCAKLGEKTVTWVNEVNESGLPYDIIIEDKDNTKVYIEVKSTSKAKKDWFNITMNEWKFALEKGESFSIACVVLSDGKPPKITVHENLLGKCQQGELQLGFRLDGKLPKITVYSSRKSTALCIYLVT